MKNQPITQDEGFDTTEDENTPFSTPGTPDKAPRTFREALDTLRAVEALPENTVALAKAKAARLEIARAHAHRLQQGLPFVEVSAGHIAEMARRSAPEARRARLESLARGNSDVRELLEEFDALKAKRK